MGTVRHSENIGPGRTRIWYEKDQPFDLWRFLITCALILAAGVFAINLLGTIVAAVGSFVTTSIYPVLDGAVLAVSVLGTFMVILAIFRGQRQAGGLALSGVAIFVVWTPSLAVLGRNVFIGEYPIYNWIQAGMIIVVAAAAAAMLTFAIFHRGHRRTWLGGAGILALLSLASLFQWNEDKMPLFAWGVAALAAAVVWKLNSSYVFKRRALTTD